MNLKSILVPSSLPAAASAGLLALRIISGLAFMLHGWGKIQNPFSWMGPNASMPGFLQFLAAVSEFGGGLAWALGLLTPFASFGLLSTMAVAVYLHAVAWKHPFVAGGAGPSYELAAVYLCVSVLLVLAGPGKFSLDRALFGEKA